MNKQGIVFVVILLVAVIYLFLQKPTESQPTFECAKNSDCKLIYSGCSCEAVPISDIRTRLESDIICIRNDCDGRTGIVSAICENGKCVKVVE